MAQSFQQSTIIVKILHLQALQTCFSHFGGVLALIFLMVSWLIYLDILFFAENP